MAPSWSQALVELQSLGMSFRIANPSLSLQSAEHGRYERSMQFNGKDATFECTGQRNNTQFYPKLHCQKIAVSAVKSSRFEVPLCEIRK